MRKFLYQKKNSFIKLTTLVFYSYRPWQHLHKFLLIELILLKHSPLHDNKTKIILPNRWLRPQRTLILILKPIKCLFQHFLTLLNPIIFLINLHLKIPKNLIINHLPKQLLNILQQSCHKLSHKIFIRHFYPHIKHHSLFSQPSFIKKTIKKYSLRLTIYFDETSIKWFINNKINFYESLLWTFLRTTELVV